CPDITIDEALRLQIFRGAPREVAKAPRDGTPAALFLPRGCVYDSRRQPDAPMLAYILRRLLLIVPTVFGIMLVSFVIIQFAPGGPVERMIAQLTGTESGATD